MSEVPTRLLRDALRDQAAASPSPACVDADTLAAWADDALSARERQAIESHAADCARCQAMLAAMAKSALPTPTRAWWRMPALGWIVPLTAAASAVLWFGTMEMRRPTARHEATASLRPASQDSKTSLDSQSLAPSAVMTAVPPASPPAETAQRSAAPKTAAPSRAERSAPARPKPSKQSAGASSDVAERRDAPRQEAAPVFAEARAEADARRAPATPSAATAPPPASAPPPAPASA